MPEAHTCPRRAEHGPRHIAEAVDQDRWETGHAMGGQQDPGLCCSFCGSLNPDVFLQLVRDGWWVGPTDKPYKAYLASPLSDEDVARQREQFLTEPGMAELAETGATEAIEQLWHERSAARGKGPTVAKVYFQHLDRGQQDEFIRLANERVMRIDIPGYFYVLPYFTRHGSRRD